MYESILLCVLRKRVTMRRGFAYLNNPTFRAALKGKRCLWTIYKKTPSNSTWNNYKQSLNKVAKLSIQLRKNYEDKLTKSLNSPNSIRTFFNYAKNQRLDVHKSISLLGDNGEILSEANSANKLSDYFSSVFSQPVECNSCAFLLLKSQIVLLSTQSGIVVSNRSVLCLLDLILKIEFSFPDTSWVLIRFC